MFRNRIVVEVGALRWGERKLKPKDADAHDVARAEHGLVDDFAIAVRSVERSQIAEADLAVAFADFGVRARDGVVVEVHLHARVATNAHARPCREQDRVRFLA
jgi:hypothetical protein